MDCEEVKKLIELYGDEGLPEDAGRHLKACSTCSAELEKYKQTWDALILWQDIEPSSGFNACFWEKLEKPSLLEKILNVLNFRVPAWAVGIMLIVVIAAGQLAGGFKSPDKASEIIAARSEYTSYDEIVPVLVRSELEIIPRVNYLEIYGEENAPDDGKSGRTSSESRDVINRVDTEEIFGI